MLGLLGMTRTRHSENLHDASDTQRTTSYGWRTDLSGMVEYRPNQWVGLRSRVMTAYEKVEYSSIYQGQRAVRMLEWNNAVRLTASLIDGRLQPYIEIGGSYLSNPRLLNPGSNQRFMGQGAIGIQWDEPQWGNVYAHIEHSQGLNNYRATRLHGGIHLTF